MDLAYIKNYLRMDEGVTDDDKLIQDLVDAAQEYIANQTGKQYNNDKIWNICICQLVAHWYDNRQVTSQKTAELPHSVTALINHISLCSAYLEA